MPTLLLGFPPEALSEAQLEAIRRLAPDMRMLITEDKNEIIASLDEIEIAVRRFPHELIAGARNLRWFQQWGAGADWLLRYPEVADLDFVLTNASGIHAIPISEHIMALLFAFARGIPHAVRAQMRNEWDRAEGGHILELAGKTLLLIGVGAIGERTARLASALEMRVWGVRRNPSMDVPGVETMFGPDKLLDLLPQADFVILTIPLTHETRGLIGEEELRAMKKSAYIFNIGRGGTIQENVLIRALREGWIAGAGLDVFETEPLPSDSPLWTMDNVIITAHYAGRTPQYDERAMAIFMDNLRRYRDGEPLHNVVDKQLGY